MESAWYVSCQAGAHMLIPIVINLVRTGKYRQGDETKKGVVPPDEICDSFSSFVDSLLQDRHGEDIQTLSLRP